METASPLPTPSLRRDKPQLSCNLCRRRKLKCDRGTPCETCTRRGLSLSCTYVRSPASEQTDRRPPRGSAPPKVQDRISQLEKLVISLTSTLNAATRGEEVTTNVQKSGVIAGSPAIGDNSIEIRLSQDSSQISETFGRITLDNSETNYVDSAHWTAILDGISELKDYFEIDQISEDEFQTESVMPEITGPELLCGGQSRVTKEELLAAIPPRSAVDRLVAKGFASMDLAHIFIHGPTFMKEYQNFWDNPRDTPVMWIGLLFGIMCVALVYQQSSPGNSNADQYLQSGSDPRQLMQTFRENIVQCLVLGRYTKGVPYTIEALLFYMHIEYILSDESQIGVWILIGMIIRLALRMGYHRDPSHFPRFSPFQGEMRRRAWAVMAQLDIYSSAQVGLPRLIRESHSDTAEPRNLLDEDLDENLPSLPPSRANTTQTPVQFFVSKHRMVSVYGIVSDLTTSNHLPPYSEVMKLAQKVDTVYETVPQWLHMRPMTQSIMDSTDLITKRIYLDLQYHKSKCVLHRRHLDASWTDNRYNQSRTTCIESALHILQCQSMLEQETKPSGRLYHDRWKVLSITKGDFLLATTILCLDLDHDMKANSHQVVSSDVRSQALREAYRIWIALSDSSKEIQRAVQALQIVLGNVHPEEFTEQPGPAISGDIAQVAASSSIPQTDLSDFLGWETSTVSGSSGIGTESFDMDSWNSGYDTQRVDELLRMPGNFTSAFDFPIDFDDI